MSDIKEPGFKSSEILASVNDNFKALSEAEKKKQINKTKGIFELQVKNAEGKQVVWTIDLKQSGTVYKGPAKPKPDVTIILGDDVLESLALGKTDPQKAFLTGKLKTKGNMMLALKLEGVLAGTRPKAKL